MVDWGKSHAFFEKDHLVLHPPTPSIDAEQQVRGSKMLCVGHSGVGSVDDGDSDGDGEEQGVCLRFVEVDEMKP